MVYWGAGIGTETGVCLCYVVLLVVLKATYVSAVTLHYPYGPNPAIEELGNNTRSMDLLPL
ncbi:uncharacterized protein BDV14DRAFT_166565 [Aspergillus stella-maris]|uniref:uncharacterized protein n=1 Tax=Aspergillus stella-maris TaxID=1810926 RepID=UPI003CCD17ED